QIIVYCFVNDIRINDTDLDCLYELSKVSEIELSKFCDDVTVRGVFNNSQSVRNTINKLIKTEVIDKKIVNKKIIININTKLKLLTDPVIYLEYKVLSNEP